MPTPFDKRQLHDVIIRELQALVDNAQRAVDRAYEAATHEENIAENKYDTLGLEASYLTQGQARRLAECQSDLAAFKALPIKTLTEADAICTSALIQVVDEEDHAHTFFLGPAAGGVKVRFKDCNIRIITTSAPLGKALIGAMVGDEVVVKIGGKDVCYEVVGVY